MSSESENLTKFISAARRIPCAGILLSITSALVLSVVSLSLKMIPEVNPVEVAIFRGLIQAIILMPVIWYCNMATFGPPGERLLLIARGLSASLDLIAKYVAIHLIAYADATTIIAASPAFVYILSWFILSEECALFNVITVTMTLGGILLTSRPTMVFGSDETQPLLDQETRALGLIVALAGCFITAITYVMTRRLWKTPSIVIVNSYSMGSLVTGSLTLAVISIFFPNSGDLSSGIDFPTKVNEISWILVNGVLGTVGQLLMILAFKIEEAGLVSLAQTSEIFAAFVFQVTWLPHEVVTWTSVVGATLIFVSLSAAAVRRWLADHPGRWEATWCLINCGFPDQRTRPDDEEAIVKDADIEQSG